jgi:PAS domain S-box-containing protein
MAGMRPRVLVVDDSRDFRRLLAAVLHRAGLHVLEAGSGEEALRLARVRPDLVLLDVELPDLSGIEVCRRLRGDPATAAVPVVMLSSGLSLDDEDRARGFDVGADGYLKKPVGATELIATVQALLERREAREEAGSGRPAAAGPARVEGDRPFVRQPGIEAVAHCLAETARRALGAATTVVWQVAPTGDLVALAGDGSPPPEPPGARLAAGTGLVGLAVEARQPLATADAAEDPRLRPAPEGAAAPRQAILAIPLLVRGEVVGVLAAGDRPGRVFDPTAIEQAVALAGLGAVALDVARRHAEGLRRRREAEALVELARILADTLDPTVVAQRVVDSARLLLDARLARLRILEADGTLRIAAESGEGPVPADPRAQVRPSTGVASHVVATGRPQWTADALADPDVRLDESIRPALEASPDRAVLAVPLRVTGRIIGTLAVSDRTGRRFTPAEAALLQAFADQAALAVENARAYEEAARRRREAELALAELRRSETFKAAILETALDAVIAIDHEGRILEFNPAAERMFGHRRADVLGRELAALVIPSELQTPHRQMLGRYDPAAPSRVVGRRIVTTGRRADGTEFPIELSVARIPLDGPPVFTGFIRDLTEHRRLEAQFLQAQKMEAVGRLAGGIAHDFNNLLTVIMGRAHVLLRRVAAQDPLRRDLDLIRSTAERAAGLTQQILAFSRKQMLQARAVDVNAVLGGMEDMLRRLIGEDVELRLVRDPALGRVRADPSGIEQVVLNLAVNARDAMPEGGRLTIETTNVELDPRFVETHPGARPGPHVRLAVADTGRGMTPETLAHLFEPFFTTKEPGKGTGLGLATVYGIVKQHDGYIEVESAPGRGARFAVYLPRLPHADVETAEAPAPERPGRGVETILVVEDEADLRDLMREVLQGHGYTVLVAEHPGEALRIAERHPGPIRLLLTDVVMPLMSGRELAGRLAALRPDLRVLYTSGYTTSGYTPDAAAMQAALESGGRFLPKPFVPETLARAVREALDAPP